MDDISLTLPRLLLMTGFTDDWYLQMGTHSTLVKDSQSVYGRMWAIQREEGDSSEDLGDDKVKAWLDTTHCAQESQSTSSPPDSLKGKVPPVSIRPDLKAQIPQ